MMGCCISPSSIRADPFQKVTCLKYGQNSIGTAVRNTAVPGWGCPSWRKSCLCKIYPTERKIWRTEYSLDSQFLQLLNTVQTIMLYSWYNCYVVLNQVIKLKHKGVYSNEKTSGIYWNFLSFTI